MKNILVTLLEKAPLLAQLNGYKRILSRVLLSAGAVLPILAAQWPELTVLPPIADYALLVCGWLGLEVGNYHAAVKAQQ